MLECRGYFVGADSRRGEAVETIVDSVLRSNYRTISKDSLAYTEGSD